MFILTCKKVTREGFTHEGREGVWGSSTDLVEAAAPSHLSIFSAASHLLEKDHNISQNDKKSYLRTNLAILQFIVIRNDGNPSYDGIALFSF